MYYKHDPGVSLFVPSKHPTILGTNLDGSPKHIDP
jgi:hypothetical protein